MKAHNMSIKSILAAVIAAVIAPCLVAASYTVSGVTASFGNVTLPSSFSGYVTSAVGTKSGSYNTFTFKPTKSGSYSVDVLATHSYGANHTVRFQIFKGAVTKLAQVDDSGAAYVSFKAGQYYTVKVQMISPSYYTTTRYDYTVSVGSAADDDDDGDGDGKLQPPTPTASQGTYAKYVKITWKKVSGATGGYNVRRSTSPSYSSSTLLKKCKSTTTSLLDTSAVAGTTYYYWVCPIAEKYYYYDESRYASGYVTSNSGGAYISGSTKVTYRANSKTGAYYLYVNGKKITSGVTWSKSGIGVTLVKTGGGAKLKMTTRPSGSYNVVYLNAKYRGKNYKKSVYIYR